MEIILVTPYWDGGNEYFQYKESKGWSLKFRDIHLRYFLLQASSCMQEVANSILRRLNMKQVSHCKTQMCHFIEKRCQASQLQDWRLDFERCSLSKQNGTLMQMQKYKLAGLIPRNALFTVLYSTSLLHMFYDYLHL